MNMDLQNEIHRQDMDSSDNNEVTPSTEWTRVNRYWNPLVLGQLPHTFLRIELDVNQRKLWGALSQPPADVTVIDSALLKQKVDENNRQRQQLSISADDPELAQFLADERVAILLQNEEFVTELHKNSDSMSTSELDTSSSDESDGATDGSSGKVLGRKLAQLARLFSRKRGQRFQQLVSKESNPSLTGEDQYKY